MNNKEIYCCGCQRKIDARLTNGEEIYPHRPDLRSLPFWKCDECGNYVGCHHKAKNRTAPLGYIPTQQLRAARQLIHAMLDPIWKSGKIRRKDLYKLISKRLGWEYHTSKISSIYEARLVYRVVRTIRNHRQYE